MIVNNPSIAVVGLGYVGLPIAAAFAAEGFRVVGFDVSERKVSELVSGRDATGTVGPDALACERLTLSSRDEDIRGMDVYIVAVPTPIDDAHVPDLAPLASAAETVGRSIKRGSIVCFESTVYPGVTEEFCAPIIARASGFARSDFKLGYSPERINPGDRDHTLASIVKVVSGDDEATLETLAAIYGSIVKAGIYRAPSIKIAESAKVIENTQRDLNIALMNELAIIFDRLGIETREVLKAAGTKWNFLNFRPGLVGGHCIGVDPYYLTHKAEASGYIPQVILAGRRINDSMGKFVADRVVKFLGATGRTLRDARVAIFGVTFKENVTDLRNSRVPDIIAELREYSIDPIVCDPRVDAADFEREYGIALDDPDEAIDLDVVVLAVAHDEYKKIGADAFAGRLRDGRGVFVDVQSAFADAALGDSILYWSL